MVGKYICHVLPSPFLEKAILAVALFTGFTWLRRRSHQMDPDTRIKPILIGMFAILPLFLFAEAKWLPLLPLDAWSLFAVKLAVMGLTFFGVGRFLIKPQ